VHNITVILPCYNPIDSWTDALLQFHEFSKPTYSVDYILVNDGSSNDTIINQQVVALNKSGISVTLHSYQQNKGKGFALRYGVEQCKSDLMVYTDIDFPFENASMIKVFEELANGNDVVIGYREPDYYLKVPFLRKVISKLFRFFLKRILRIKITDTQCGLKGFNSLGRKAFLKTSINRYLFDFEFIYRISKAKVLKIKTVSVVLKDGIVFRKMPLKTLFSESFSVLRVILSRQR
jgi:glycosyltransferase involved in cell wall biosynthesis